MQMHVSPDAQGPCPHCGVVMRVKTNEDEWRIPITISHYEDGSKMGRSVYVGTCPSCEKPILDLTDWEQEAYDEPQRVKRWERAYPQRPKTRPPPPELVPSRIRQEYEEAAAVEHLSQRAAAALLRRCLQSTLRDQGFKDHNLAKEIDASAKDGAISGRLRAKLHIVRQVGNYSAHPVLDGNGDHLTVEPGEVAALFGALDDAFDVFYVQPSRDQELLSDINKKLAAAGKPPIEDWRQVSSPDATTPKS